MRFLKPNRLVIATAATILALGATTISLTPPVWELKNSAIKIHRSKDPESFQLRGPNKSSWQPLDKISKHTQYAIMIAEDARFLQHFGIDWRAILASIKLNLTQGKIARGGSTITQQLVKLAFLSNERTINRKIKEALGAIALEQILTKDQILEWYLNLVPFGHGRIGIREATSFYFDDPPEHLDIASSIQLALVIPRPSERAQDLRQKKLSQFSGRRYRMIAQQMLDQGYITEQLFEQAISTGNFGKEVTIETNTEEPETTVSDTQDAPFDY